MATETQFYCLFSHPGLAAIRFWADGLSRESDLPRQPSDGNSRKRGSATMTARSRFGKERVNNATIRFFPPERDKDEFGTASCSRSLSFTTILLCRRKDKEKVSFCPRWDVTDGLTPGLVLHSDSRGTAPSIPKSRDIRGGDGSQGNTLEWAGSREGKRPGVSAQHQSVRRRAGPRRFFAGGTAAALPPGSSRSSWVRMKRRM